MKNIHVLPTDKPSRLIRLSNGELRYNENCGLHSFYPQHIYITSDEEIEDGDWFLDDNNQISHSYRLSHVKFANPKKIILTTDQDLIKDGVQEIPDEFLKWFVKNPSCEYVKTEKFYSMSQSTYSGIEYEIIIPKEEPKQETLEEVAERLYPYEVGYGVFDRNCEIDAERQRFIEGVKWQKEQDNNKYSDEDVIELLKTFDEKFNSGIVERNKGINNWFEQFKKK